jgi:hypothetical protein
MGRCTKNAPSAFAEASEYAMIGISEGMISTGIALFRKESILGIAA